MNVMGWSYIELVSLRGWHGQDPNRALCLGVCNLGARNDLSLI